MFPLNQNHDPPKKKKDGEEKPKQEKSGSKKLGQNLAMISPLKRCAGRCGFDVSFS
jgi:hypothetical protein